MKVKKSFVFFLAVIVLVFLLVLFINKSVEPNIIALCENTSKSIALKSTNEAVKENINNIVYENLVTLQKDSNGKITAINADVMEMNRLSNNISTAIQDKLNEVKDTYVRFPIASVVKSNLLSGFGPKIKIQVVPTGNVTCQFKSNFESTGINQTRHRIFLEVTTRVTIIAPFYTKTQEYVTDITVAETIIIGEPPSSYYNITGVEGLTKQDTLNMVGN
jgi:sporulation protein YunB